MNIGHYCCMTANKRMIVVIPIALCILLKMSQFKESFIYYFIHIKFQSERKNVFAIKYNS